MQDKKEVTMTPEAKKEMDMISESRDTFYRQTGAWPNKMICSLATYQELVKYNKGMFCQRKRPKFFRDLKKV